ncbi:MAG: aldo/keto reductase [Cytophagales bacterium]|nr:aldo/keto reductase [Cytophagales bacterium]
MHQVVGAVFQNLLKTLQQVAIKNNCSIANVASRYMLEQAAVGGVIIGARLGKSEHIQENLSLLSLSLNEESKNLIKENLTQLSAIQGDCGDEYRKPPFLTASGGQSEVIMSKRFHRPYPSYTGGDGRTKALSGTVWEDIAGFSRAVKKGNRILVSGTTATHGPKSIGGNDPVAQNAFRHR